MKTYKKYMHGLYAALFLSLNLGSTHANAEACVDTPQSENTLDCNVLRRAVLYSVQHKHQGVSLPVSGTQVERATQLRGANSVYKDFLHWTAVRDRVTIGNLLTESQRKNFNPSSHEAEGFAVMWLNVRSVDMEAYYDQFWTQRENAVVVTTLPAASSIMALRD